MLFDFFSRKTDARVGRAADWSSLIQLVWPITGSLLMSWIVSTIEPIMRYGYGAVALTGIAAALIISLVVSLGLIAWRYFHPLPQVEPPVSQAALFDAEESQKKLDELERKLEKVVNAIFEKLHNIEHDRENAATSTSTITNRITSLEEALAPAPFSLLNSILHKDGVKPESRLAEIEAAAERLADRIEETKTENIELHQALRNHVKSQIQQIDLRLELFSTALKAKEARAMIAESDEAVLHSGRRLMSADDGYDDRTWEIEYNIWHTAVERIDKISAAWFSNYERFLQIDRRAFENATMPTPRNIVGSSDANSTRYKTVQIVQPLYANRRIGIIQYFDSKSREFF